MRQLRTEEARPVTIIHREPASSAPHFCTPPPRYTSPTWQNDLIEDGIYPTPAQGEGTIWRCDYCGKHQWFRRLAFDLYHWAPVRWWNFDLRRKIKETR